MIEPELDPKNGRLIVPAAGRVQTDLTIYSMNYAYVRVSTEQQSGSSQRFEISNWAGSKGIEIDKWIEESKSGTLPPEKRVLGKLLRRMRAGDTLICTEISRLGRNLLMVMGILNACSQRGICIRTIKDNFELTDNINSKIIAFAFGLAAEIERNLISQRTKEALADKKASGVVLGRPSGRYKCRDCILLEIESVRDRHSYGESWRRIAMSYGIHRNTLARYLKGIEKDTEEVLKKI